jgi:hypothetical protein
MQKTVVNIYRNVGAWCYALWIDGEFDHSDQIDDCDSEDEARAAIAHQFPGAAIVRVASLFP